MWVVYPIRRQCTRSNRVQRPVAGVELAAASRSITVRGVMYSLMLNPFSKSHAIPLRVFQLLKSERWYFAVFEVVLCLAVGELHAELVDAWTVAGRSPRLCL